MSEVHEKQGGHEVDEDETMNPLSQNYLSEKKIEKLPSPSPPPENALEELAAVGIHYVPTHKEKRQKTANAVNEVAEMVDEMDEDQLEQLQEALDARKKQVGAKVTKKKSGNQGPRAAPGQYTAAQKDAYYNECLAKCNAKRANRVPPLGPLNTKSMQYLRSICGFHIGEAEHFRDRRW